MKRSEMVDILVASIYNHIRQPYESEKEMCSAVLTDIEKAGMLPPAIRVAIESGDNSLKNDKELIYKWEEE